MLICLHGRWRVCQGSTQTSWPISCPVSEKHDKWRMYTDYTDLNEACPKDVYPRPLIDQLVDHWVLSFLDAYSGYNQILMHLRDKAKTVFMTNDANYYAFQPEECRWDIPEANGQSIQGRNRPKCRSLCGWHHGQIRLVCPTHWWP